MKGLVFGGVLCLPSHPDSDMHGLIRCIVRTKSAAYASAALRMASGIDNPQVLFRLGIWSESASAIERMVTEQHYGEVWVCPLVSAYITASKYRRLDEHFGRSRGCSSASVGHLTV